MMKNNSDNNERYALFLDKVKKDKAVWLLKAHDGLYAMVEDNHNITYLPVWPDENSVKTFATDDWEGYSPDKMMLKEFLEWMQELKSDNIIIAVYPDTNMHTLALDPLELRKQIIQLIYDKPEEKA